MANIDAATARRGQGVAVDGPDEDDLSVGSPGPSADRSRARRPLRAALAVVTGLIFGWVFLLVALVAWFLVAGGPWGWVPTALAFGAYAFAASWLTLRWLRPPSMRRAAMWTGVVFAGAGIAAAHWAPPTPARLRQAIEGFEQPGWTLTKDETNGSRACWDVCTSVTRAYRVHLDADEVLSGLAPLLAEHRLRESNLSEESRTVFSEEHAGGGDMDIWIDVVREGEQLTTVSVTADANS